MIAHSGQWGAQIDVVIGIIGIAIVVIVVICIIAVIRIVRGCRALAVASARPRCIASNRGPFIRAFAVFLHVLRQIRLLRIRFSTILADVCFQMLRFLMLGNVLQQRWLIGEAFVA